MSDYSNLKENENIKVFIRLRPPANGKERTPKMFELPPDNGVLCLRNPKDGGSTSSHKFKFDATFDENEGQEAVFRKVAEPLVSKVLAGFNACCFAYGQTGSGKTHSIYGSSTQQVRHVPPAAAPVSGDDALHLYSLFFVRVCASVCLCGRSNVCCGFDLAAG